GRSKLKRDIQKYEYGRATGRNGGATGGRMRIIETRMTRYASLLVLTATLAPPAQARALMLEEFEWPREAVFCGLSRAETVQDKNAAGKYFFVTALLNDPQAAIERGYAQLGTQVEELDFVDRNADGSTEVRRYRTR